MTDVFRFVEFETKADLQSAVEKLDNREFKGTTVHCLADVCPIPPPSLSSLTCCRSKTNAPMLAATVNALLPVVAMMTTTTDVALLPVPGLPEATVNALPAVDLQWKTTTIEATDAPPQETMVLLPDAMRLIHTMPVVPLLLPVAMPNPTLVLVIPMVVLAVLLGMDTTVLAMVGMKTVATKQVIRFSDE
jgi:hypothetical protein